MNMTSDEYKRDVLRQRGPKKRNKYGAIKTVVDGIKFDSKAEARRYGQLKVLKHTGVIWDLELQPKFPVVVEGKKICTYKADFSYVENGKRIVEDVKSPITAKHPVYRIKKKLVEAIYGIEIKETS